MQGYNIFEDISLSALLETCGFIAATRGAGKSVFIRGLLENFSGKVQQIVFDPEGEFATLRPDFPFAYAAVNGGDIPLSVNYAETLCEKIMQSRVSIIIDLYDLTADERLLFVERFFRRLMNLKKELYHDTLVYLDEAQLFCNQADKSECGRQIIDAAMRGRKRGIGLILSSLRLAAVDKNATAQCLNKFVGVNSYDEDIKRCLKELGLPAGDSGKIMNLKKGHFYGRGPALSPLGPFEFAVPLPKTKHIKMGTPGYKAPAPAEELKDIFAMFADLPADSDRELKTIEQLQDEVVRLRGTIAGMPVRGVTDKKDLAAAKDDRQAEIDGVAEVAWKEAQRHFGVKIKGRDAMIFTLLTYNNELRTAIDKIRGLTDLPSPPKIEVPICPAGGRGVFEEIKPNISPEGATGSKENYKQQKQSPPLALRKQDYEAGKLGKCARAIVSFLAGHPERDFTKAQIGVSTGYSVTSSGFQNSLSELAGREFIIRGARIKVNARNLKQIAEAGATTTRQIFNADTFKSQLGKCELEVYNILLAKPKAEHSKEGLAEKTPTGYSPTSSGFQNSISRLVSLELAVRERGMIRLNPELLELL